MIKFFSGIKAKAIATLSSFLSVLGVGGSSASAVCQTTCVTSSAVLPLIGVSLSATPLAFLQDYQLVFWWVAFAFLCFLTYFYLKGILSTKTDRALIAVNAGLLTIGLPYFKGLSLAKLFPWAGGILLAVGLFSLISSLISSRKFNVTPHSSEALRVIARKERSD